MLDGLFAALAFILVINPFALFELGLQFSALCVLVIALCLPAIQSLARRCFPVTSALNARGFRPLLAGVFQTAFVIAGISLCIQIVLLPLSVKAFGSSGLLFPLNMLWLPLLGAFVLPVAFLGLFAAAVGLGSVASFFFSLALLPCQALTAFLEWLDAAGWLAAPLLPRPHWLACAGYWLLCLSLPVIVLSVTRMMKPGARTSLPWAQTVVGLLLFLLPVCGALWKNSRTAVDVSVLDVGQGQSVLVRWSGLGGLHSQGRLLVDGGGFPSDSFDVGKVVLAPILTDNALPRLYGLINSHPDADHLGGLLFLLEHFAVERYFGNGDTPVSRLQEREERALTRTGLHMERLRRGDVIELAPGLVLEVLWPVRREGDRLRTSRAGDASAADKEKKQTDSARKKEQTNDNSLVLRLVWQGRGLALIPGDIGKKPMLSLLEDPGVDISAHVLVLPHHGSRGSHMPTFYDKVNPRVALAACGQANYWGYPAPLVADSLKEKGIPLYSTSAYGQISLRWTAPDSAPDVRTALEGDTAGVE